MAKTELKTKQNDASVEDFLSSINDDQQRADSAEIARMMENATGDKPKMWGPAIIGFGSTVLKYPSGRELDWMKIGFSPRKANISLYGMAGDPARLQKLGKYKTGGGCLYIKRLADVDRSFLQQLIDSTVASRAEES